MRRLRPDGFEEIIAYNLREGGTEFTEFEHGQPERVRKAREIIAHIRDEVMGTSARIVEPGCSTGDISGFFARRDGVYAGDTVVGIDVTPGAATMALQKWPGMIVLEDAVENVEPMPCDILVMCEFLEHIVDPVSFVEDWAPLARYVVIGHPLVGDGWDPEPGHLWAYTPADFEAWFTMSGHTLREAWTFEMAGYNMAIGWGERQ